MPDGMKGETSGRPSPTGSGDLESNACPYCHAILDPPPRGNWKKCPMCGERIIVKRMRGHEKKCLVTVAHAQEENAHWEAKYLRDGALTDAAQMGAYMAEFEEVEKALSTRLGRQASPSEVRWQIADVKLKQALKRNDWSALSTIYWYQALWLYQEGREHHEVALQNRIADLKSYRDDDELEVAQVKIMVAKDSCPACRQLDGQRLTLDEALANSPIPKAACERGWCRCMYTPVIEWLEGASNGTPASKAQPEASIKRGQATAQSVKARERINAHIAPLTEDIVGAWPLGELPEAPGVLVPLDTFIVNEPQSPDDDSMAILAAVLATMISSYLGPDELQVEAAPWHPTEGSDELAGRFKYCITVTGKVWYWERRWGLIVRPEGEETPVPPQEDAEEAEGDCGSAHE